MTKHVFRAALTALATVTVAGVVYAATTTNSPGAQCVASGSGTLKVRSDGEAENATAATVTAVCPADRPTSNTKVSGQVFVIDQNPSADVCCRVVSKNAGGAVVQSAQVCSSGTSASYQNLVLPEITDIYTYSHYYIQCDVPPINGAATSRIQMYRTTQQ